MRAEIVNGQLYRLARIELLEMINQQIAVHRVGMIEIRRVAIIQRHIFKIAVIQILLDKNDFVSADGFQYAIGDRSFT